MEEPRDIWSIGIYFGRTPLAVTPHPPVATVSSPSNPVLTASDVTDATDVTS